MNKIRLFLVFFFLMFVVNLGLSPVTSYATTALPMFSVKNPITGEVFSTNENTEELVLYVFFSAFEAESGLNIEQINKIKERYSGQSLLVAAICLDMDEMSALRYVAQKRPEFDILLPQGNIEIHPGNSQLPFFLLVNSRQEILQINQGKAERSLIEFIDEQIGSATQETPKNQENLENLETQEAQG